MLYIKTSVYSLVSLLFGLLLLGYVEGKLPLLVPYLQDLEEGLMIG